MISGFYRKTGRALLCILAAFVLVFTEGAYPVSGAGVSEGGTDTAGTVKLTIDQEYAQIGQPLTVTLSGVPEDTQCTYTWSINGTVKSTEASYTPVSSDLEKKLTVTVTAFGEAAGTYTAEMYISKLPVVYIDTENSQAITSKENYISGDLKIQGNSQYNSGNTTLYDGDIQIRGRGNTTWGYDKKPYKVKLGTKTDLFGFGSNKHWVLLANYTDESHLRNTLAYNLSGAMGMPYMQSVHVDLILNGVYQGTYQLCEQIKIAKARVNIHDWEDYAGDVAKAVVKADDSLTKAADQDAIETQLAETDMSWLMTKKFNYKNKEYNIPDYLDMPDMTGGFLIELDSYYDEVSKFKSSKNQPLQFKNPEFIATSTGALNYVKNYINAFEAAIDAGDYTTEYEGKFVTYSQLFDMDSLVQFWLVNELFMNVDAMKKSSYMYKDIDGLFHMGPIWDMDWSSDSLVSNSQGSGTYNAWQTVRFSDQAQADQWYKSIIQDPYFAVQAYELYQQMKETLDEMTAENGTIDTYKALLMESADANAEKWYADSGNNWGWGGGWPGGNRQDKSFATQTTVLKTYLTNRLNWMDQQFASPETLASSLGYTTAQGITVEAEDIITKRSGTTSITADVTNSSVMSVEFLVNGINMGTAATAEGKAVLEVPVSTWKTDGSYNTVQVFGLDASGTVLISGKKKVTDFAVLQTPKEDTANPGGGDDNKPGDGDDNKPGGDDNNSGGDDNNPGGDDNKPGGDNNKPGGDDNNSGGDDNKPGGDNNKPGGDDNKPGGDNNKPGGDNNNPGGENNNPGGSGSSGSGGSGTTPGGSTDGSQNASGISAVDFAQKTAFVPRGTTAVLTAAVTAQTGADKTVSYTSSDPSIAQVSSNGTVKGLKKGKAVITATAGKYSDTCTVTVSEVTLNAASAPMQKKQKTTAVKVKSCYPADDKPVSWKSSKPSVASVSKSGKITAKKTGTAVITVTMKSGAKASCKIKVGKGKVKTTRLAAAKKKIALKKGKSFQVKLTRTPVTANDKLTYSVKNKKIASVSAKGKIKALKRGSTRITVKAGSKKVQLTVTVK